MANFRQLCDPILSTHLRFMTTGPDNVRTSTNDSESFDSLPLPRDVSLFQEFDTAMESHLSTDDLPPNLQSDESLRLLAKSRLFNSFCIANTNDRVMELNKHIANFVVKHFHLKRTHCIVQEESEGGEDTTLATAEEMANHNEASIPVHDLPLFRGARVTLLRNIALSRACANRSTFIVMEVGRHSVKLMNVTRGTFYGAIEFMFRVKLTITLKKSLHIQPFTISSSYGFSFINFKVRHVVTRQKFFLRYSHTTVRTWTVVCWFQSCPTQFTNHRFKPS